VYRTGLSACEEKASLWYNLAVLEEDCGRIPEALESYRASVAQDPEFADAHFNLARLYAAMGKSQDALRAYNDYRRLQRGA
jgi:tetratricopeptide (TPR) repeat protein